MTRESKIGKVIRLLRSNQVETDYCSPNYVADFATHRGIKLTSDEVLHISNIYQLKPQENE
jgi:mRNA-degrading endonuclease YafQ of YafQ-DinJ toxin-antitoxin module